MIVKCYKIGINFILLFNTYHYKIKIVDICNIYKIAKIIKYVGSSFDFKISNKQNSSILWPKYILFKNKKIEII